MVLTKVFMKEPVNLQLGVNHCTKNNLHDMKNLLFISAELHPCHGAFRITPVDVNSRPSSCLTNFLLNGQYWVSNFWPQILQLISSSIAKCSKWTCLCVL